MLHKNCNHHYVSVLRTLELGLGLVLVQSRDHPQQTELERTEYSNLVACSFTKSFLLMLVATHEMNNDTAHYEAFLCIRIKRDEVA